MGVNLVPKLGNFRITTGNFPADDISTRLRCITTGNHRVLRFFIELHNIGNTDLVIGRPEDRTDLFVFSEVFNGLVFREKFYTYRLVDEAGTEKKTGFKVAFCIEDFAPPNKYTCGNQGISVGSHDTYGREDRPKPNDPADLPCQFIEIDNIPDGKYILEVTANAYSVQQVKSGSKPLIEEDNYDDNTASVKLQFTGNSVQQI
jgi:Lysyl oxidase